MVDATLAEETWHAVLSDEWNALGPFPMHAREQHFLSPSYPINLSEPIDYESKWPSAYADNGMVGWQTVQSSNGALHLSYPEIRWASLRATEGWAALQHHSVLRTSITIHPPPNPTPITPSPNLLIDIQQGSFFAIRPAADSDLESFVPNWHAGNIYAMDAALPHSISLPSPPSTTKPTVYDLFVSGDYEIRLFGDPTVRGTDVPTLSVSVTVGTEILRSTATAVDSHHVIPNFVEGWSFGDALGVGLRSSGEWWTVEDVQVPSSLVNVLTVHLLHPIRIAPTQTRVIPLAISQRLPVYDTSLPLEIHLSSEPPNLKLTLVVRLDLQHARAWDRNTYDPIISTYFYASSTPTAFVAIPPMHIGSEAVKSPLLALHGAGVNVLTHRTGACLPPRQHFRWVVIPTGRTAWGLDWHGPSSADAWASIEALSTVLERRPLWSSWGFPKDAKVVLLGHSNGGQGTWYNAARYPDRVLAAIPAAAYSKAQSYVSLVQSRSAHFIDPSLRAILESSFTPDDNDLFLSNLADTPILAIHGGADDNVPVWHTRALIDTLKTWRSDANVTFKEDYGEPHCYNSVFRNDQVKDFIDSITHSEQSLVRRDFLHKSHFTLTVAVPSESGSLHGFRILKLETPGRLARLTVECNERVVRISPRNVAVFSIDQRYINLDGLQSYVNGVALELGPAQDSYTISQQSGVWTVEDGRDTTGDSYSTAGRMSKILSSPGPLTIVISQKTLDIAEMALRLVHDLDVYHKLDAEIIDAHEAQDRLDKGTLGHGNLVTIGGAANVFTHSLLRRNATPFSLSDEQLHLRGRLITPKTVSLFLHPHPVSGSSLALVIYADDEHGLERLLRLFPMRTGISVPDWVVIGPDADYVGAGAVEGAGVWGNEWSWNDGMSSF